MGELLTVVQPGFQVLVGSGSILYAALEAGAVGGILGVANFAPRESVLIHSRFVAGDAAGAGAAQELVAPLHNKVVGGMGVAGVKHALDLLGYVGGSPRRPLPALPESRRAEVAGLLADAGLPTSPARDRVES